MIVRLLKSFSGYRAGQVFDWADGMARIYVARGMAEAIKEQAVEQMAVEERTEKAVVQQSGKRRVK